MGAHACRLSDSRIVNKPFCVTQDRFRSGVCGQSNFARSCSLPPSRRKFPFARICKRDSSQESTRSSQRSRGVHAFAKPATSDEGFSERDFSSDLEREVRERFGPNMPFMQMNPSASGIAEDVVLECELWRTKGRESYRECMSAWQGKHDEELNDAELEVLRVSEVGPGQVVVSWQTTWIPPALSILVDFGRSWPGVKVELFDVLDKYDQITRFRWRGLYMLFFNALTTGIMRIPAARIKGTTTLTFDAEYSRVGDKSDGDKCNRTTFILKRHSEILEVVSLFRDQRVKNKRIARDTLLFFDVRRPPTQNLADWDDHVWDQLFIKAVPGMGMFDIDGLEDGGDRAQLYEDLTTVLAFLTFSVLVLGTSIGYLYFQQLQGEAYLRDLVELYD